MKKFTVEICYYTRFGDSSVKRIMNWILKTFPISSSGFHILFPISNFSIFEISLFYRRNTVPGHRLWQWQSCFCSSTHLCFLFFNSILSLIFPRIYYTARFRIFVHNRTGLLASRDLILLAHCRFPTSTAPRPTRHVRNPDAPITGTEAEAFEYSTTY